MRRKIISPDQSMEQLGRIVRERVDSGRSTGIVAGMAFPDGQTRVVAYGDAGEGRRLDDSSVFDLQPKDPRNPFADYTVDQLYTFLEDYELTRDPGSRYEYSNLGVGLLGHALALRAQTSYEELACKRILDLLCR